MITMKKIILLLLFLSTCTYAQTMRIITPWAVGGGIDSTARVMADQIERRTQNKVIVIGFDGGGDTYLQQYDYSSGATLDVEIKADFEKIPPEYHQMFLQMMQIRYGGILNIWDNTQPFAPPKVKKKWWQFWK